jgi:hypothetical protein
LAASPRSRTSTSFRPTSSTRSRRKSGSETWRRTLEKKVCWQNVSQLFFKKCLFVKTVNNLFKNTQNWKKIARILCCSKKFKWI